MGRGLSTGYLADIGSGRRSPRPAVNARLARILADDASELLDFASKHPDVLGALRMIRAGGNRWGHQRVIDDVQRCLFRWRPR